MVSNEAKARTPNEAELEDPLFVHAVSRAFQVLSAFHSASRPLSLDEIAKRAGIGRSGAQRIVHTLRVLGYVGRSEQGRGYLPGIRLLDHTRDFLRLNTFVINATPILLDLRRNARERVDLSIFDDLRLVYAVRLPSKRETFFTTLVGNSVPTFCTAGGRAIMAHLTTDDVDDIIARSERVPLTDKTITDPEAIKDQVRQAKQNGYAFTQEEVLIGEVGIGAAVLNAERRPMGAVHIAGSLSEWTPETFSARFAPLAVEAAHAISQTL